METTQMLLLCGAVTASLALPATLSSPANDADPAPTVTTQPGLVDWHDGFDAAIAAAQTSGKPVLLFQLLGDLDQALC